MISVVLYPEAAGSPPYAATEEANKKGRKEGRKEGEEKFPKHLVSRNVKSLAAKEILAIGIRALLRASSVLEEEEGNETKSMKSEGLEEEILYLLSGISHILRLVT